MFSRFTSLFRKFRKISFADPIEKAMPSIVHIDAELVCAGKVRELQSSGWIWKKDYIISCCHGLHDAGYTLSRVSIKFYNGKETLAKLILKDPRMDIALLKLENSIDTIPAKILMTDDTKVGDVVIILGCGFGFSHSAQTGILIHKRRIYYNSIDEKMEMLQIDSYTLKGASGGLVINQNGVGIGMLQEGQRSFGFAIPIGIALLGLTHSIKSSGQHRVGQSAQSLKLFGMEPEDEMERDGKIQDMDPQDCSYKTS